MNLYISGQNNKTPEALTAEDAGACCNVRDRIPAIAVARLFLVFILFAFGILAVAGLTTLQVFGSLCVGILAPALIFTPAVAALPLFLILASFLILTVRDTASGSLRQVERARESVRNPILARGRVKDQRYSSEAIGACGMETKRSGEVQ